MATLSAAERAKRRAAEAEFFNSHAHDIGAFNPFTDRGWGTLARCFEKVLPHRQPLKLLDVGCGTGHSRQLYIKHCSSYTGIDLSSAELALARQSFPQDEFIEADACEMPFADASFDAVCFSSVLHHIPEMRVALQQAFRVLRPGGLVFAYDPNVYHPAMALFRHPKSPLYSAKGVSPNEKPLKPRSIHKLLVECGYGNIRQWCQSNIPYRRVDIQSISSFLGIFNAIDWFWQLAGPGYFFGTFIISSAIRPSTKER
ncbi:MAG: class I SAM-dependent methyltransferase [Gemmatales bacterium]